MAVPRPAVDSFLPNFTHRYTATRPLVAYTPPQHSRQNFPSKSSLLSILLYSEFRPFFSSLLFIPFFFFFFSVPFPGNENCVVALNFRRARTHPVFGVALHFRGSFSPRRVRVMRFSIAHPAISSSAISIEIYSSIRAMLLHASMHSSYPLSVT